jgi:hypothetical protein
MPIRSNPQPFVRTCRAAVMAGAMLLGLGSAANAQSVRAGGSIGVSLIVLQPAVTQPVRLLGFDVDRNGLATLRTTAPVAGPASRIVMTGIVHDSSGGVKRVSPLLPATESAASLRYVVDLGSAPHGDLRQPVQLRLQYLTVAGT